MATIHVAENVQELCSNFAGFVESLEKTAIKETGKFSIGLSGGSSATIVSNALSGKNFNWEKWHVFFCDERFVSLSDPDSNYYSLKSSFFDKVAIPKQQVYTVNAGIGIEDASKDYSIQIKSVFGETNIPQFDLLVLGMGPDGHICSLFPNHPLLNEKERWTAYIKESPKPPPQRITLTLPVINNAKSICFTVTGGSKAEMVQRVIKNPFDKNIPASMVATDKGTVNWFLDKESGKLVS